MNVDAVICQKKLKLSWTYSQNYHKASTIVELARNYVNNFRQLILGKEVKIASSKELKKDEETDNIYPLSPLQKGLLFHAIEQPCSESYIIQLIWKCPETDYPEINYLKERGSC